MSRHLNRCKRQFNFPPQGQKSGDEWVDKVKTTPIVPVGFEKHRPDTFWIWGEKQTECEGSVSDRKGIAVKTSCLFSLLRWENPALSSFPLFRSETSSGRMYCRQHAAWNRAISEERWKIVKTHWNPFKTKWNMLKRPAGQHWRFQPPTPSGWSPTSS